MKPFFARSFIKSYSAPVWADSLRHKPTHRLQLAQVPTPIHRWRLTGVPASFKLFIKRDDLTGCMTTGTKIRKLEFILGRAVLNDCRHVIAAGSTVSNCCRTVAAASRMLDLMPHFIMWDADQKRTELYRGNMNINRILHCDIHHLSCAPDEHTELVPMMKHMQHLIQCRTNEGAAIISYGGFDPHGLHGIVNVFQEMMIQGLLNDFDDIVLATGSGATATGLAISNYLTGSKIRIHALISEDSASYLQEHMAETLDVLEFHKLSIDQLLDVIENCHGAGYAISTNDELGGTVPDAEKINNLLGSSKLQQRLPDFRFQQHDRIHFFVAMVPLVACSLVDIARTTGILLDPIYTIKATRRLLVEMNERPDRFKGNRILFLHTGGMYANFDGRLDSLLCANADEMPIGKNKRSN